MSYAVLESDPQADRAAILGLWHDNLPAAADERYAWLYQSGAAEAWVLRTPTGAVVGSTGLMPRTMRIFGQLAPAAQAIDLNVDRQHRTIGPALQLQRAVIGAVRQRGLRLLYGFPTPQSEPVLRRGGYRPVGELQRWVRPLRAGELLKSRLPRAWMRRLATAAYRAFDLVSPARYVRTPGRQSFFETAAFDARFDDCWAAQPAAIVGDRSAAYLNWRFARCPTAAYRALCLADADGALRAYLVYRRQQGRMLVVDLGFRALADLDPLLAELLRRARRQPVDAIVLAYLGADAVGRRLKRFGFRQRPANCKMLVLADRQQFGADFDRLTDPQHWHVTWADLDVDG